jgi:hypothetical protein
MRGPSQNAVKVCYLIYFLYPLPEVIIVMILEVTLLPWADPVLTVGR